VYARHARTARSFFLEHRTRSPAAGFKLRPPRRSSSASPRRRHRLHPRLVCMVRTPPLPLISCAPSHSTSCCSPAPRRLPRRPWCPRRHPSRRLGLVVEFALLPATCRSVPRSKPRPRARDRATPASLRRSAAGHRRGQPSPRRLSLARDRGRPMGTDGPDQKGGIPL
jgi:hypothetical protein